MPCQSVLFTRNYSMTQVATSPLIFDPHLDLFSKLQQLQRKSGAGTISEIVRDGLTVFNFNYVRNQSKNTASDLRSRDERFTSQSFLNALPTPNKCRSISALCLAKNFQGLQYL